MPSLLLVAALRLLSPLIITTYFVPDELFQSAEPAHVLVFGTGHLSWEWKAGLRSPLHAILLSLPLYLLRLLNLDYGVLVFLLPRLLHSLIFLAGDVTFFKLCRRLIPSSKGQEAVILLYLSNWFLIYCAPRTLANSLETSLTLLALAFYPHSAKECETKPIRLYLLLATVSIIIRPTSALLWLVFGLRHLWKDRKPVSLLFKKVFPVVVPTLLLSIALDSWWYGRWTWSLYNFAIFNTLEGGSAHFGVQDTWWYAGGLASTLTLSLIPIAYGLARSIFLQPFMRHRLPLGTGEFFTAFFYLAVHTALPHKEHRFLLPILPLLILYAGAFFDSPSRARRAFLYLTVAVNAALALYLGMRHQAGPMAIGNAILERATGAERVIVLAPCYTMPGHAFFHDAVKEIRGLDCSPPTWRKSDVDEADNFNDYPVPWVHTHGDVRLYDMAVLYEWMWKELKDTFEGWGWKECARAYHGDFLVSRRQDHVMILACRR